MTEPSSRTRLFGTFAAFLALPAHAVVTDLVPMQKGYFVATCLSGSTTWAFTQDSNGIVGAGLDGTDHTTAPTGLPGVGFGWTFHLNEKSNQNPGAPDPLQEWTGGNLGEVFGIAAGNPSLGQLAHAAATSASPTSRTASSTSSTSPATAPAPKTTASADGPTSPSEVIVCTRR